MHRLHGFPRRTLFRGRKRQVSANTAPTRPPVLPWLSEPLDLLDRLERYWYRGPARDDSDRPKRATEEEIAAFESTYSVKLPADFREYLLRLNGIGEDPQVFRFWPLQELRPVGLSGFNLRDRDRYFLFADYLIESHYYAIYLGDDPQLQNWVIIPCMPKQPFVATSFSGFIELYLQDVMAIYGAS